jgi:hypothetical protein
MRRDGGVGGGVGGFAVEADVLREGKVRKEDEGRWKCDDEYRKM